MKTQDATDSPHATARVIHRYRHIPRASRWATWNNSLMSMPPPTSDVWLTPQAPLEDAQQCEPLPSHPRTQARRNGLNSWKTTNQFDPSLRPAPCPPTRYFRSPP